MASTHTMFVYGTLKRGEPNHKLLANRDNGQATFRGTARTVDNFPLVIASRYNLPFLLHAKGWGKSVVGEIYDVDDSMLMHLDILEEHPRLYERVKCEVVVTTDDVNCDVTERANRVTCWIYFLRKYKPHMIELPHMESYSSRGLHGLEYDEGEDLSDPEAI